MHDEEGGPGFGTKLGVVGLGKRGEIVEELDAVREDGFDDLGPPGVDAEDGRENLGVIGGAGFLDEVGPAFEEWEEAGDFFLYRDGTTVGARAFGPNVDDVGSVRDGLEDFFASFVEVERAIEGKGIIGDVDDAH